MYCLIKDSRVQKGQVIGCNPTACPTWDISTLFSVAQSLLLELGQHLLSTEDAQCPPAFRIESVPSTHTALLLDACNSFPAGRCPSIHPLKEPADSLRWIISFSHQEAKEVRLMQEAWERRLRVLVNQYLGRTVQATKTGDYVNIFI